MNGMQLLHIRKAIPKKYISLKDIFLKLFKTLPVQKMKIQCYNIKGNIVSPAAFHLYSDTFDFVLITSDVLIANYQERIFNFMYCVVEKHVVVNYTGIIFFGEDGQRTFNNGFGMALVRHLNSEKFY